MDRNGNVFVIAAILLERNLQSVANYLIVSLAVADLMVACLVMPLGAVYETSRPPRKTRDKEEMNYLWLHSKASIYTKDTKGDSGWLTAMDALSSNPGLAVGWVTHSTSAPGRKRGRRPVKLLGEIKAARLANDRPASEDNERTPGTRERDGGRDERREVRGIERIIHLSQKGTGQKQINSSVSSTVHPSSTANMPCIDVSCRPSSTIISGDALWDAIEERCGTKIDSALKEILVTTKYASLVLLSQLTKDDKLVILKIMRKSSHLVSKDKKDLLYDFYKDHPEEFDFMPGQEKMLQQIVVECQRLTKSLLKRRADESEDSSNRSKVARVSSQLLSSGNAISVEDINNSKTEKTLQLRTQLEANINKWVCANVPELIPLDTNFTVKVVVVENGFGSYVSEVACPATDCNHTGHISMNKHKNWAVSNFYRHLKKHAESDNQPTVKSFFSGGACKTPRSTRTTRKGRRICQIINSSDEEGVEEVENGGDFLSEEKQK
ncbi:hypothetical protein FOCC_FOCC007261 [Frankliniella occidentalis]|nr:hypothetical protein FOCC_FOCC007261 [Frankliniella occidentalis]